MSNPSSPIKLPVGRTIFVGVVVPAMFVWLNDRLFAQFSTSNYFWSSFQLLAVCVVQVGVFGVLCGKLIEWPVLRWLIYGWCWLLVAIQLLSASWLTGGSYYVYGNRSLLINGMFGAQLGLVTIWAILGTTRLTVRLPIAIVLATLLSLPAAATQWSFERHPPIVLLAIQTVVLAALCGVLRCRGYRLLPLEHSIVTSPEQGASHFGVRDVFVWIATLAIALAAARAFELFSPRRLAGATHNVWILATTLTHSCFLAMVLVVALWAALGRGPAWLRWSLLAISSLLTGFTSAYFLYYAYYRRIGVFVSTLTWDEFWDFWENYRSQVAAIVLPASLLFATLLIVRVHGYRLQRLT